MMRKWIAAATLSLISILSCVSPQVYRSPSSPVQNVEQGRIFMLVGQDGIGTTFPVGTHTLATASHLCDETEAPTSHYDPDLGLISGNRFLGFGQFSLLGIEEPLDDLNPSYLISDITFARPYKMRSPKIAFFGKYVSILRGHINIWIMTKSVFVGTPPIPGESGSPVLQLQDKEWVAVGVVTHSVTKGGLYARFRNK